MLAYLPIKGRLAYPYVCRFLNCSSKALPFSSHNVLPKYTQKGNPFRPIVSSRHSVAYDVAKELASLLQPLVGKS